MKKLVFLWFVSTAFCAFAQVDDFEAFKMRQQEEMQRMMRADSLGLVNLAIDYNEYCRQEEIAYQQFIEKIKSLWGVDNFAESSVDEWVEYYDDDKARSVVNFKTGKGRVQIVVPAGTSLNDVKTKMDDCMNKMRDSRGKTKDYDTEMKKSEPLLTEPVLKNQIDLRSLHNAQAEAETFQTRNGENKVIYTVSFNLLPNHLKTRATQYSATINKYCLKYNVEPELVYAMIYVESAFNPKAKSSSNAYGLMQIIPKTAGADAAKGLDKPFQIPTENYLYNAENNIEMGVFYIHLLETKYFSKIKDKESRRLCVVASYNCGVGSLSKVLRGDTNISKAVPLINNMNYERFSTELDRKLPSSTSQYVKNVFEKRNLFLKK